MRAPQVRPSRPRQGRRRHRCRRCRRACRHRPHRPAPRRQPSPRAARQPCRPCSCPAWLLPLPALQLRHPCPGPEATKLSTAAGHAATPSNARAPAPGWPPRQPKRMCLFISFLPTQRSRVHDLRCRHHIRIGPALPEVKPCRAACTALPSPNRLYSHILSSPFIAHFRLFILSCPRLRPIRLTLLCSPASCRGPQSSRHPGHNPSRLMDSFATVAPVIRWLSLPAPTQPLPRAITYFHPLPTCTALLHATSCAAAAISLAVRHTPPPFISCTCPLMPPFTGPNEWPCHPRAAPSANSRPWELPAL